VASRLYSSTRHLYRQVAACLAALGLGALGSATLVALIGLYVTGLILLDVRQTQTRVTRFLPARCHDALNRLLRLMPLSTRVTMGLLVTWVKRMGLSAYLCLDDVIIEKAFACKLPWAGWTYSFAKKRKVYGVHIVVWLWCDIDSQWRIPLAFRVHRPKRSCVPHRYRTKLQLAEQMLKELAAYGLSFEYLVFDTHYTAGWFTKMVSRLDQGMVRHVSFVLLTFVVLQMMRVHPNESEAAVKERWQVAALRHQETPPSPPAGPWPTRPGRTTAWKATPPSGITTWPTTPSTTAPGPTLTSRRPAQPSTRERLPCQPRCSPCSTPTA
jgi:hypothetical protein